jgi:hypothetical protein
MKLFNYFYNEFFLNFNTNYALTLQNRKLAIINRLSHFFIFGFLIYDLVQNELYLETEIPSGYTTMWAESRELYNLQERNHYEYCDNSDYNFIWEKDEWEYTNISCVNLHYSESYIKGEKEMFYLTYYRDQDVIINHTASCPPDYRIKNYFNNISICEKSQNFFTTGIEGMILAFDHFFTTSFVNGGNIGNNIRIKTRIRDSSNSYDAYVFNPGETVSMNISEWLKLAGVDLEDFNYGSQVSVEDPLVSYEYPRNRITGVDLILKINYYNMKSFTGSEEEECEINVLYNTGWASKGSHLNYMNYPRHNKSYHFVDRYKYGIKFKFIASGMMGQFNFYNVVNHFVSGIVLIGMATKIIAMICSLIFVDFGKLRREVKPAVLKYEAKWCNSHLEQEGTSPNHEQESPSNISLHSINNSPVTEKEFYDVPQQGLSHRNIKNTLRSTAI